jgi:hypothetical protein
MNAIEKISAQLMSDDFSVRRKGLKSASDLRETENGSLRLLELAARSYPLDKDSHKSTSAELLELFWGSQPPGFIPAIERIYDALEDKAEARSTAVRALMNMESEEASRSVVRLLARPSSRTVGLHWAFYIPLRKAPQFGLCMFPGVFEVIPNLRDRSQIYQVILAYVHAGRLDLNRYPSFQNYCLERTADILDVEGGEAMDGTRSDESPRLSLRRFQELEVLLDVLRFFDSPRVEAILARTLAQAKLFNDRPDIERQKLRLFAACSLLGRGLPVDAALLELMAVAPELRWRLWSQLETVGRLDAFPDRYREQRLLSEAEMVQWLEHPMEMGTPPEEVHLLAAVDYDDKEEGRRALFLFRFRRSELEEGEWLVGAAGPYPFGGSPTIGGRGTFSRFKKPAEKTLEEHAQDYLPDSASRIEVRQP